MKIWKFQSTLWKNPILYFTNQIIIYNRKGIHNLWTISVPLVQNGINRFKLVQTDLNWSRLIQTGRKWSRLIQTRLNWCRPIELRTRLKFAVIDPLKSPSTPLLSIRLLLKLLIIQSLVLKDSFYRYEIGEL